MNGYDDLGSREDYEDEGYYANEPDEDEDEEEEGPDFPFEGGEDAHLDSSWEDRFEMMGGGWD